MQRRHFMGSVVSLFLVASSAWATESSCLQLSEIAFKLQDLPGSAKISAGVTAFKSSRRIETPVSAHLVMNQVGNSNAIYFGPRNKGPELALELAPERGRKYTQDGCEKVSVDGGQEYWVDHARSTPQMLVVRSPKNGNEVSYTLTEEAKMKRLKIARSVALRVPESLDCVPSQKIETEWELVWDTDRNPLEASIQLRELTKLSTEFDEVGRFPASGKNLCERQRSFDEARRAKRGLPLTAPF